MSKHRVVSNPFRAWSQKSRSIRTTWSLLAVLFRSYVELEFGKSSNYMGNFPATFREGKHKYLYHAIIICYIQTRYLLLKLRYYWNWGILDDWWLMILDDSTEVLMDDSWWFLMILCGDLGNFWWLGDPQSLKKPSNQRFNVPAWNPIGQ